MTHTVLHIEDDFLWAGKVLECLRRWPEFRHVGTASTGAKGIELFQAHSPAIVLLDLRLPDQSGLSILDEICRLGGAAKTLLLTARADDFALWRVESGTLGGMIFKTPSVGGCLREALATLARGERYLSSEVRTAIRHFRSSPLAFYKILSAREQDLLRFFAEGQSDREVAAIVGTTNSTVRNHRQNIMRKLGIHGTLDLLKWCQEKGFCSELTPAPPCAAGGDL